MKRFSQVICLLVVLSVISITPAYALESSTWGSNYFNSFLAYLHPTTGKQFQIWIEVDTIRTLDKLGASEITVQRSTDNSNWTDMTTYTKSVYTGLVASNAFHHEAYVTYSGSSNYYYRAKVWFYGEKDGSTALYSYTTESIYIS